MRLLEPYFRISETTGVHIHAGNNGELHISLCNVKATGNKLEITKKVTGASSLQELAKHCDVKVPVAINLSGKGILIKKVGRLDDIDAGNFARVLPNGNPEDFYLQNFISGDQSFVALIRRTEADQWLEKIAALGLSVLTVSLGPFVAEQVLPQLNFYGEEVLFDGHHATRNEKKDWVSYRYVADGLAPFPVKLEAEKLDERLILPYAAAFQLVLAAGLPVIKAEVPVLEISLNNALKDRKIQVFSFAALGIMFILLLANFLIFSNYNTQNNQLAEQVGRSSRSITDVEDLNAQIKVKEARLDSLGWEDGIKKSLLIDAIAQMLPPEVTWEEVAIDPQVQTVGGESKRMRFESRKIKIKGQTQRIVLVNEWIGRVRSLKWVKNVQLEGYNYKNEQDTGQFTVTIDF
ncbi:hypothetical protein KHS38_13315 [Mucilaginibacter sp. Bleaf8]|uniref:hypothetical protein n=1 Tax=Mucilaginibacter sp. Bleaf8 TaxID=2834430 RepID=UPI001BCE2FC6|nr:hypothetical protein [Mucilaginibacter sp. Bleaf8]MBS7565385.1 hypothetical protein [Mucilaginibacter sp. Bleaf8]